MLESLEKLDARYQVSYKCQALGTFLDETYQAKTKFTDMLTVAWMFLSKLARASYAAEYQRGAKDQSIFKFTKLLARTPGKDNIKHFMYCSGQNSHYTSLDAEYPRSPDTRQVGLGSI